MKTDVVGTIAPFVIVVLMVAVIIENIGTILLVLGAIALVIFLIVIASKDAENEKKPENKASGNSHVNIDKIVQNNIDNALQSLTVKYGNPDRIIRPEDKSTYGYFALFAAHKVFFINDNKFQFVDIASFKLVDNYQIERGGINGKVTTTTDTCDVFFSSVVGKFWGGKTGAIIGGATATKHSAVNLTQSNDVLVHDYTLLVNLKGVNREGIEMHLGNDWRLAAELEHIFSQIIESGRDYCALKS